MLKRQNIFSYEEKWCSVNLMKTSYSVKFIYFLRKTYILWFVGIFLGFRRVLSTFLKQRQSLILPLNWWIPNWCILKFRFITIIIWGLLLLVDNFDINLLYLSWIRVYNLGYFWFWFYVTFEYIYLNRLDFISFKIQFTCTLNIP